MNGNGQEQLQQITIGQIAESTTNPRKSFAGMEELKASIAASGIHVPLLIRPLPEGRLTQYELVCGSRRLRVARELKLKTVPCIVRAMSDDEARETQIVENLQRADVHPVEEAEAYAAMIESASGWSTIDASGEPHTDRVGRELTAEDIAKRVGKAAGYVAQRLKLLTLGLDAKLLFSRNHLTLGHALLLARLTEADQGRALMWMLDADPKYVRAPLTEIIRRRLVQRGEEKPQDEGEQEEVDYESSGDEPPTVPNVAKYMREGGRLIDATEAQLKRWIEANVLLKLADVPWRLDDANLLPAAGACVSCPKRSGSNAALFGDLTAAEDVCLDPACFAAKQDAVVKLHKQEARKAGADALLKISSKHSREKLDPAAVLRVPATAGGVPIRGESRLSVTAKTVREGQWVPAKPGSCPLTVQGLMVDGPDKGKLQPVCADQACKVHKHVVQRPHSGNGGGGGGGGGSWEKEQADREAKRKAYVAAEVPVRKAVYAAIKRKIAGKLNAEDLLRRAVKSYREAAAVCEVAGIEFEPGERGWESDQNAAKPLADALAKRTGAELLSLAFDILHVDRVIVMEHMYGNKKQDRAPLWKLASEYKVNADAIAEQLEPKPAKVAAPAKVKKLAKAPAKKAAKKKAVRK